jgi:hypothetical protein
MRSTDDAATWASPAFLKLPPPRWYASDQIVTIGGALWSVSYATSPGVPCTFWKSSDNGYNWYHYSELLSIGGPVINESALAYLGGYGLLVIGRDAAQAATYQLRSRRMGLTWDAMEDISSKVGILQYPTLTWVGSHLVLAARERKNPVTGATVQQTAVFVSDDTGNTFDYNVIEDYHGSSVSSGYAHVLTRSASDALIVYSHDATGTDQPGIRIAHLTF